MTSVTLWPVYHCDRCFWSRPGHIRDPILCLCDLLSSGSHTWPNFVSMCPIVARVTNVTQFCDPVSRNQIFLQKYTTWPTWPAWPCDPCTNVTDVIEVTIGSQTWPNFVTLWPMFPMKKKNTTWPRDPCDPVSQKKMLPEITKCHLCLWFLIMLLIFCVSFAPKIGQKIFFFYHCKAIDSANFTNFSGSFRLLTGDFPIVWCINDSMQKCPTFSPGQFDTTTIWHHDNLTPAI